MRDEPRDSSTDESGPDCSDLLGPVILAEALALDHDPVAHAPGHLVVGDQQVPAALREDGTGGPVSGGQ